MQQFPQPFVPHSRRLEALLYGPHAVQRESIERLLRIVTLNVVACLLLCLAVAAELTPAWSTGVVVAYGTLGGLGFYAALRSGFSRRWQDPSLAYPLLLFSASAVALSYALIEEARGAALQLLCLLLAFEMDRLNWRQLLKVSLYTIGALAGESLVRWVLEPHAVQVSVEVYNLLMAGVLLPVAILVAAEVRRLHKRQFLQHQELGRTLTQLKELSTRDALTGLLNRRHMSVLLEQEQKRQRRSGQPFHVAILDIDWFKRVNDQYGHGTGDAVLQAFSKLASAALVKSDTLARWGGEEFLLLMPGADEARAVSALLQVREAIAGHDWNSIAPGLQVGFSAGASLHGATDSMSTALERADRALYQAKENGRGQTIFASEPDSAHAGRAESVAPIVGAAQPVFASGGESFSPSAESIKAVKGASKLEDDLVQPPQTVLPSGLLKRLGDLVLSQRADVRDHLRMPMLAMALYAIWVAVFYWYAIPSGQMDATLGMWLIRYDMLAIVAFYPLIRSGWSARHQDGKLALPQVLVACGACMLGYAAAPVLRASVLHLMCVVQVFAMVSLYPRASRIAGAGAVSCLLATLVVMAWIAPPDFNVKLEALKILMTCFVVGRLSMLAYDYSQVREKVESEKRELGHAVAKVQELVIRDALTGLFNRKHLQDLLIREHERSGLTGHGSCLALIDLDHFKRVNDTHGHHIGDEVLQGFAKASQSTLRESDVIGRWGGEEFLVLMYDTAPSDAGLLALERLRTCIADATFPSVPTLKVTFSCGILQIDPNEPIAQMLERVDRALYKAKAGGRNQCVIADRVVSPA
ncbi:MAG: GGDEF domain-containing protein [Rubrivivax sp.]|nr:MAG: GGDEF domain-containing protein [Rubrivivax sp.]